MQNRGIETGIGRVTFREISRYFGYYEMLDNLLSKDQKNRRLYLDLNAKKWLTKKWLSDFRSKNAKSTDYRLYCNPVEFIEQ